MHLIGEFQSILPKDILKELWGLCDILDENVKRQIPVADGTSRDIKPWARMPK